MASPLDQFDQGIIWYLILVDGGVRIWMHWAPVIDWGANIYIGINLNSPLFTHLIQFKFADNEIPQKCINVHWREKSQIWGLIPNSRYLYQNIFWHWKFQFQFWGLMHLWVELLTYDTFSFYINLSLWCELTRHTISILSRLMNKVLDSADQPFLEMGFTKHWMLSTDKTFWRPVEGSS